MGFFSDIVEGFTGQSAAKAAERGSAAQVRATEKGIKLQRQTRDLIRKDLSPYRLQGAPAAERLGHLTLNPDAKEYYLNNSPIYGAQMAADRRETMANQAARGKLGSGGTLAALQQNVMRNGESAINNEINRLSGLTNIGQNSAAMAASNSQASTNNITELLSQGANAQAAGGIGAANAHAQGANNLIALGTAMFSDRRLKRNLTQVGEHKGYPVYDFQYIWGDEWYTGVMAQDVPHAAFQVGNYLAVDYGAI